jgi:hypothetical protein
VNSLPTKSAGAFIAACMKKTAAELNAATNRIEPIARQYGIPTAWAAFYVQAERQVRGVA